MDIATLTGTGLISFGGVWFISLLYKRWKNEELPSEVKFGVAVAVALVWGFIPPDLSMVWANQLKDAIAIATGFAGVYQFSGGVAKKVGT